MEKETDHEESIKLSEAQDYKGWSPEEVALYVIQHIPIPQKEQRIKIICDTFRQKNMNGERLQQISKSEWDEFITRDVAHYFTLPPAEHQRGVNHPVVNTIIDIHSKLFDCRSGIWFTALQFFKRMHSYDAVYNDEEGIWCHDRGGRPYFNPGSWRRYGFYPQLEGETKEQVDEIMSTWHVAYHGTKFINVNSIVQYGLVPPDTEVGGVKIVNQRGKAGTIGSKIPVYVSPSILYASHWCYTQPHIEKDTYIYCVFQVRVRPGSFRVQGNTLWSGGWPDKSVIYDERFGPDELEWLVEDASDLRVTGLMVRKSKVNPEQFFKDLYAKHKKQTETPRGTGKGVWKWNSSPADGKTLDPNGPFSDYEEKTNAKLEKAYMNWQAVCYLGNVETDTGINPYFVDFNKMEQIRCDNNKLRRAIKREVVK
eukprot:TRINITY_DN669_c0_g2_i3.p1 TRINITY_DN669_c0_g2~~TRINITY_DN669_c0_g2_i3.p1  ORF type:complete len:424 (+),score=67.79 TRINITY_DN669_c0_g2_i3:123-1394(+)